jgi:quercetin dioxygenase-like cupin family protein
MKRLLVAAALISFPCFAMAQDKEARIAPDALAWKENPAFPKGVQVATLVGDPSKAGEAVVLRIKFPANFQMPPHTHPYSEVVTLISGPVGTSHGEKFEKNGEMLKPGSLWVYPAKHAHYAWTANEGAVLQVQFTSPGGIDYINPADDPRKK